MNKTKEIRYFYIDTKFFNKHLADQKIITTFAPNFKHNSMNNIESQKGEIVMYQPDETIRLEVRVEDETVWLSQQQIADLFQSSRTNVVEHIMHIYEDEELEENSTCRKFRQVRKEGKRTVSRVLVRPEWAYKERGLHPSRPRSNYKKQLIHSF